MDQLELLTAEEVARILRISLESTRRLLTRRELRGRKVGREWRVRREDLESYIRGESSGEGAPFGARSSTSGWGSAAN